MSDTSLDPRTLRELKALKDESEIRRLVARYADAVIHPDAEAWLDTWTEDGRWTVAGNACEGHAALLATWTTLMGCFEHVVQLPQAGQVEVAGDAGTGRWSVLEIGRDVKGDAVFTIACYDDVYRRTPAGWKFAERTFRLIYSGAPDLSGQWLP